MGHALGSIVNPLHTYMEAHMVAYIAYMEEAASAQEGGHSRDRRAARHSWHDAGTQKILLSEN